MCLATSWLHDLIYHLVLVYVYFICSCTIADKSLITYFFHCLDFNKLSVFHLLPTVGLLQEHTAHAHFHSRELRTNIRMSYTICYYMTTANPRMLLDKITSRVDIGRFPAVSLHGVVTLLDFCRRYGVQCPG
jgi:hypothetical protein